ncbi:hypothetical protein C7H85_03410 [Zobellella endophytica]|uniref:Uncharacterized protein n=1 Tax=Zobellella endophytica TaxID=2116700 RepID=A0A2P7RCG4_9GAMM|nr:hypothetical protein [Zobellella endophytica]PSJ47873.1 hypothetical protein C7H85_03410 [Zobellella endophytica]
MKSAGVISGILLSLHSSLAIAQEALSNLLSVDVEGVVVIPTIAEGRLLYLHGIAGEGVYISRNDAGELCMVKPLHIVAGNVEEGGIRIHETGPLTLRIYSDRISATLKQGEQVTSEKLRVTDKEDDSSSDVVIENGMSRQMHFILNPRRKWTSWLRGERPKSSCKTVTEEEIARLSSTR